MSAKNFTLSCACGASTHTFLVSTPSLPLPSHLCNCNVSRHISGSLLTSYVNITHDPNAPRPNTSNLTAYDSSSILRRWFCTTCGTHMYLEYHADGHFEAATGTLQVEESDRVVRFESCMWAGDTRDGGASEWVGEIDGRVLQRWDGEAGCYGKVPPNWPRRMENEHESDVKEAVYAHCHCRGIEFWITPPNSNSLDARSPFPDLIIPHYLNKSRNEKNVPWWLPNNRTRYLAGTCTCTSCRRASGFDITFWSFIPTANIFIDAALTSPFPASGQWGTMSTYTSSPGVTRTFCSRCGANVFLAGNEEKYGRAGLVDVAVGLLDAKSGARAEELLAWWDGRVSFEECAINRGLVRALERGLGSWGKRMEGKGILEQEICCRILNEYDEVSDSVVVEKLQRNHMFQSLFIQS